MQLNEKTTVLGAIGAAIFASVCCIGPVLLAGFGVGAVAGAQKFAPLRPIFLAVTAVLLGLGFYFAYRKPKQAACAGELCKPSGIARWTKPLLWIATAIVLALVTFPHYYGPLRAALDRPTKTSVVSEAAQVTTVELKVSGMTCSGCAASVKNALMETPGVMAAEVNWEAGRAKVRYDAARVSTAQLLEAVKKTGFKAAL